MSNNRNSKWINGQTRKPERGEERTELQSAARHTFLGSPWFRWWNRATWKLCVSASAFMKHFERKPKDKNKTNRKKQHKSVVERSRPDKIDNEKPSVGQFEQWHLVRSTRSNESCGNQKAVQTLKHDITVNYWDYGNTVFYSNKAMAWMRILLTVLWCAGHVRMCLQYLTRCLPSLS